MSRRAINIGDALQQLEAVLDDVHELAEWPEDVDEQDVVTKIQELTVFLESELLELEAGQ